MGLAWSSREGWGRAGIPNPFPHRCSFSALLGLGRVAVSESCVLYAVLMARAFLNLM